jgi:hypothetical protein
MANINLTMTTTPTPLPAGVTFGGFKFILTAPSGNSSNSGVVQTLTWTFQNAAPGTYTASVEAVDTTGAVIGTPVTIQVPVPVPAGQTYEAPTGLSFTLS